MPWFHLENPRAIEELDEARKKATADTAPPSRPPNPLVEALLVIVGGLLLLSIGYDLIGNGVLKTVLGAALLLAGLAAGLGGLESFLQKGDDKPQVGPIEDVKDELSPCSNVSTSKALAARPTRARRPKRGRPPGVCFDGSKVRQAMEQLGITLAVLAVRVHKSEHTIRGILRGRGTTTETADRICEVLDVPLSELQMRN